jgi:hypothetical protein
MTAIIIETLRNIFLPFWCVFYVRQAIKTAVRDLVLHGIVSQSNRPSIINGVRFYDCCSNINCRLSRSKKASNINFSHEWKKSQIFNKDECKYLFLPFQLKNKACRFHSFIRMSISCLLHKISQRHVPHIRGRNPRSSIGTRVRTYYSCPVIDSFI